MAILLCRSFPSFIINNETLELIYEKTETLNNIDIFSQGKQEIESSIFEIIQNGKLHFYL